MVESSHSPVSMSERIIFDTSVLVDHLRTDCHRQRIEALTGLIRNSSVVMAELWRGVVTSADREVLRALARNHPTLTPTEKNWLESGEILAKIRADRGLSPAKLRDLHFDVLIALTARSHGARLITSNRSDFEMIDSYRKLQLEIW
ncbi:MAG: PIN domain-containing protein [Acidobacteriia bacterium]|nr:PIN domain-containing protein [Terriglobia bacterium]